MGRSKISYKIHRIIIVISKLHKRHSKVKRRAPAYSRGVVQRIVRRRLRSGCQKARGGRLAIKSGCSLGGEWGERGSGRIHISPSSPSYASDHTNTTTTTTHHPTGTLIPIISRWLSKCLVLTSSVTSWSVDAVGTT